MGKRSKGGRPRKSGPRYKSGQRKETKIGAKMGDAMTPELLQRRADLVGAGNARDQMAAYPIGQMRLAGLITDRQWRAGSEMAVKWRQWSAMADAPRRDAPAIDGTHPGLGRGDNAQRWAALDKEMTMLRAAVMAVRPHPRLAMSLLESTLVDEVTPPRLLVGWAPDRRGSPWVEGWSLLRSALDAAADALRIPRPAESEPLRVA